MLLSSKKEKINTRCFFTFSLLYKETSKYRDHKQLQLVQHGFTLIELLVSISIMSILVSLAYPSFMEALCDQEARRIRTIFVSTIKKAKAISYSNHRQVLMCLTDDMGKCDRNATEQLILFFDTNKNNKFDNSSDVLIEATKLNLRYASVNLRAGNRYRHHIRFAKDTGTPRGFFGHFKYCPVHASNDNMYQLSFNQVGGVRHKPNSIHPTGC